jgi:DMSO/TMAO reductase YedYZ molybdopterin-dependent catalytic subunit
MMVNAFLSAKCLVLVVALALVCALVPAAGCTPSDTGNTTADEVQWDVTLVGENETVLSYADIKAMPACEGYGGFFTTVGVVNGPYHARGVSLEDLCELAGGMASSDVVRVSAPDGYSMVFSHAQLNGDFVTYEPSTMKEVPHGELEVMLMYEQDGQPLFEDCGRPLRVAIVGSEPLLTEGHYWVKWVSKIEVLSFD